MAMITSAMKWLIFDTVYGIAAVAAIAYVVLKVAQKMIPKLPEPAYLVVPIFIIGLFTIPSIPRYQFEDDVLSLIEEKQWMRVVTTTKRGSLTEPLTWFRAPIESFTIIMPGSYSPVVVGEYREVIMRFHEKQIVSIVEPFCDDHTIIYAQPDSEGIFRLTTKEAKKMNEQEKQWYCEYDWSKENEALRKERLSQSDANKNQP